jgi:hypothetical protein
LGVVADTKLTPRRFWLTKVSGPAARIDMQNSLRRRRSPIFGIPGVSAATHGITHILANLGCAVTPPIVLLSVATYGWHESCGKLLELDRIDGEGPT